MKKIIITMRWGQQQIIKTELFESKQHAIDFYNTTTQELEMEYNNIKITKIEEKQNGSIKKI